MKSYLYKNIYIGKLLGSESNEHREIIDEYAKQGYRYAGYIPTVADNNGKVLRIDLIFEKDES